MATPSSRSSASPGSARPRSGTRRSRVRAPGRDGAGSAAGRARGEALVRRARRSAGRRAGGALRGDSGRATRGARGRAAALAGEPAARTLGVSGTAFLSLLRQLADERAVVVAVDDFHWLDRPSTSALEFALRRLPAERVRAILSVRSGEAGPLARLERDGPRGPARARSALGRLAAPRRLDTARQDVPASDARADRAGVGREPAVRARDRPAARTSGTAERSPARLPVPESLPDAGRVARSVAAARDPRRAPARGCAGAARPPPGRRRRRSPRPRRRGSSGSGPTSGSTFVHPLFASAVYSSAPLDRRRETHRALADVVRDPEERARHLALGLRRPGRAGGARRVEAAARGARLRGAPDTAAELTELALRLLPEGSPAVDALRLDLAEHLYLASDFQRSSEVLEGLRRDLGPGDLRARALLALAEIDYWRKGESAAAALAEEALLDAHDPLVRARCHAAIAMYAGTVDLTKAAAAARAALALLDGAARRRAGPRRGGAGRPGAGGPLPGRGLRRGGGRAGARSLERRGSPGRRRPTGRLQARSVAPVRRRPRRRAGKARARPSRQRATRATSPRSRTSCSTAWSSRPGRASGARPRRSPGSMADAFAQQGVESEGVGPWRAYVDAHAGRFDAVRAAFEPAQSRRADRRP